MKINCKIINNIYKMPSKSHIEDSGMDLYISESFTIHPLETLVIGLNFALETPIDYTSYLVPRSSIAKKGIIVHNALIDPGYTGEIHLIITNASNNVYEFKEGDRIASLIIVPIVNIEWNIKEELNQTERGNKGFGSSGK